MSAGSPDGRTAAGLAALSILTFAALYAPSLGFGYYEDDFDHLSRTWAQWLSNPLLGAGRPVSSASWLLVDLVSTASGVQRAVNLGLFLAIIGMTHLLLWRARAPLAAFLMVPTAFAHPAFLWPVTWIAQRNDLLLLVFVLAALLAHRSRWAPPLLVLAAASKTPFLFHNLAFATRYLRERRWGAAALTLGSIPLFLAAGFVTYYHANQTGGRHGLYQLDSDSGGYWLFSVLLRPLKVLEAIFLNLFPLPAVSNTPGHLALAAGVLLLAWTVVGRAVLAGWRTAPGRPLAATLLPVALGLSVAYLFGSDLRMCAPTVPFLTIALAALARPDKAVLPAIAAIAAVNLWGVALNYDAVRTECFLLDPHLRKTPACAAPPVPAVAWTDRRRELVDHYVREHLRQSVDAPSDAR